MTQRPRSLDLYPAEYERILKRVADDGTFFHTFASEKEANTIKTDFNRYRVSVLAYLPDSWQADVCRNIMLKKGGSSLEWAKRSTSGAISGLRESLDNPEREVGSTDEEADALRKLEEDIMKGNYN